MTKRARLHCVRCVAITWSRNNCKKIHVSRNIADGAWCLLRIPERLNQFEWDALHLMQHRTKPSMDFPSPPNHRLKFLYAWTFAHGMADFLVTIKKFSCRWWWRHLSWWEDSRPLLISLLNWEGKARLGARVAAWPLIQWWRWPSGLTLVAYRGLQQPAQASPASFSTPACCCPPSPLLGKGRCSKEGEKESISPFSVSTIRLTAPIQLFQSVSASKMLCCSFSGIRILATKGWLELGRVIIAIKCHNRFNGQVDIQRRIKPFNIAQWL